MITEDELLSFIICLQSGEHSLVPRPIPAIRVRGGGLEPSGRVLPTSFTGDVTTKLAGDDWGRGWGEQMPVDDDIASEN